MNSWSHWSASQSLNLETHDFVALCMSIGLEELQARIKLDQTAQRVKQYPKGESKLIQKRGQMINPFISLLGGETRCGGSQRRRRTNNRSPRR